MCTDTVEYWKSRAKTAELKVLTFYEEIKKLGGAGVEEPSVPQPAHETIAGIPLSPLRFVCLHGDFPNPCEICQGTFVNCDSGAAQEVSPREPLERADEQIKLLYGKWARAEAEVRELRDSLRKSLSIHWLSQIECHHEDKNDSAICACGWKSAAAINVGKAVELWIDHIFAACVSA